ncbi:hypothetical protein [Halarsenatibacter silvermanii]|uniref:Uncharacterized protein n=1 Tax=Halarsenatibacter silvermanii TaxID=321763 RepID=A0A1G9KUX9_9FIRM|nr:hypothetical protein [Halarsenatibacter silvermanii]SDL53364.1 hypothetical protein SAMN04488692_105107 [Halarsenatibacter silvermanii]
MGSETVSAERITVKMSDSAAEYLEKKDVSEVTVHLKEVGGG